MTDFDTSPKITSEVTTDSILTEHKLPDAETKTAAETKLNFIDEVLDLENAVVTVVDPNTGITSSTVSAQPSGSAIVEVVKMSAPNSDARPVGKIFENGQVTFVDLAA